MFIQIKFSKSGWIGTGFKVIRPPLGSDPIPDRNLKISEIIRKRVELTRNLDEKKASLLSKFYDLSSVWAFGSTLIISVPPPRGREGGAFIEVAAVRRDPSGLITSWACTTMVGFQKNGLCSFINSSVRVCLLGHWALFDSARRSTLSSL